MSPGRIAVALATAVLAAACGGPQREQTTIADADDCDCDARREPAPRSSAPDEPTLHTPMPSPAPAPRATHRYRGRLIDLDVKDADLHNVFRFLAEIGGVNIVVADSVRGSVTLRLHQVPWDQALAVVAKVKHLQLEHREGVYYVLPASR